MSYSSVKKLLFIYVWYSWEPDSGIRGENIDSPVPPTLAAESLTFLGDSYAQYSLLLEGGGTGGRSLRQEGVELMRSTFEETVSLRFRTEEGSGLLFYMGGGASGDSAFIQVCRTVDGDGF